MGVTEWGGEVGTLIIIPTYNERKNIRPLIAEVFQVDQSFEVLVVDDNSPDGTGEEVDRLARDDPRVHVIHRPYKMGLGSAYITGFKYALRGGYNPIFEMDADFSHDPQYLPQFLEKIEEYDLVIGSRYLTGVNVVNWPISRLLLSYYANLYARTITGLPVRDTTSGFKCFRKRVLESIDLDRVHSDGYSFQIEMTFRAWKKGFRICEIPIIFVDRHAGSSKMSKRIVREAIWMVWWLRIQGLLGMV